MSKEEESKDINEFFTKYVIGCVACHGSNPACVCLKRHKLEKQMILAGIEKKYRRLTITAINDPTML